ncbi:MAG: hypothetical protein CMN30_21065 [Sandaracinus sp.]|nr:hypothetical protein [Sandaracinus sp.]
MTTTLQPAADGFFHPADGDQVAALIAQARAQGVPLRVRGSAHSVEGAIFSGPLDGSRPPANAVTLFLDRMRGVTIDPKSMEVVARAGTHLGKDPYDPTKSSTWGNSLDLQLDQAGYALGDLGGISHQTVAGFLSTGSSGGSLSHSLEITGITLIDGTGQERVLREGDDELDAAKVAMGLLGVITEVRFRILPRFGIFGDQITCSTSAKTAPLDMFAPNGDPRSLASFLQATPYTRLMWWPQKGFERVQVWRAARMEPLQPFTPNPYMELGRAPRIAALAGCLIYTVIGNLADITAIPAKLKTGFFPHLEGDLDGEPDPNACPGTTATPGSHRLADVLAYIQRELTGSLRGHQLEAGPLHPQADSVVGHLHAFIEKHEGPGVVERDLVAVLVWLLEKLTQLATHLPGMQLVADELAKALPYVIAPILGVFVSDGTQTFWDGWRCGLPMDNQMDDQLWPTQFTELWVPLERCGDVMNALHAHYAGDGTAAGAFAATGAFSCEVYGAKKSDAWLSPAYGTDVVRIDVFRYGQDAPTDPRGFYDPFWQVLKPFGFRPHWGKWLPAASPEWRAYYGEQLPRLEDFKALRAEWDPDGVFLSDYWKQHLIG